MGGLLKSCGFTVYTVWQKYDPYARRMGKQGKAYKTLMQECSAKGDKGREDAHNFCLWHAGELRFDNLSSEMQDLAVITHVAEVGRMYSLQALKELISFLADVANGDANWSQLKERYSPAFTSKEDPDYDPNSDDEET